MATPTLPTGRYLSILGKMRFDMGGQTHLVLMRQRMFKSTAGVDMPILTFDGSRLYPRVRERLLDTGLMAPESELTNMVDWYLSADDTRLASGRQDAAPPVSEDAWAELAEHREIRHKHENRADGSPWRVKYQVDGGVTVAYEYLRDDGTVALRIPTKHPAPSVARLAAQIVSSTGSVVAEPGDRSALHRHWLDQLTQDDERIFVLSDSRFALAHLIGLSERFHLVHQMHNPHLIGRRHFLSTVQETYVPLMEMQNDLDGLVSLTERQRQDIALRYGRADNLYVISNPVEMPPEPTEPAERSSRRIVTMARLHPQKRLHLAIRAFALLLEDEPGATFDIYGRGELEDELQSLIEELGIAHAVTLRGYDPHARASLREATAYWVTSGYEGYPLATLEAMSHGCPVISFDIKYGPREQITDGVNGYLVPDGDLRALADRTLSLMTDRALLARHSAASIDRALEHSHQRFLADTAAVLHQVAAKKPERTKVDRVEIQRADLRFGHPTKVLHRPARRFDLTLDAHIDVSARSAGTPLRPQDFVLELFSADSELIVPLPISVDGDGRTFEVTARIDHSQVAAAIAGLGPRTHIARLRLGFAWRNSTWFAELAPAGYRVVRGQDGSVRALADREDTLARAWARITGRRSVRRVLDA